MDILFRIIDITFPLFSIVALGLFCGYRLKPDMAIANRLNMDVFLPALIFSVIIGQGVDVREYFPLIIAAAIIVLGSGLLVWPLCRFFGFEARTLLPPVMFNNAGNMGLPLLVLTFGEKALPIAMILFLVENTLHFTLGMAWLNRGDLSLRGRLKTLVSPIILVSIIAVILGMYNTSIHPTLLRPIDMIGQIAIPLMLFSLGVRLSTSTLKDLPIGLVGAIACPLSGLLIVAVLMPFISLTKMEIGALFLFACLPPAVLNFMFAERYQQEPEKVASIVVMGNGLTLITLPLVLTYVLASYT